MAHTDKESQSTFLDLMTERQAILRMSDEQLAKEIGLDARVIKLVKKSKMKFPSGRLGMLAAVLDVPLVEMLRVALREQDAHLLSVIEQTWDKPVLTINETKLLEAYRHMAKGRDVVPLVMDATSLIALVAA